MDDTTATDDDCEDARCLLHYGNNQQCSLFSVAGNTGRMSDVVLTSFWHGTFASLEENFEHLLLWTPSALSAEHLLAEHRLSFVVLFVVYSLPSVDCQTWNRSSENIEKTRLNSSPDHPANNPI